MELLANKLTSTKTMLPFSTTTFLTANPKRVAKSINMGQILMGSNIEASPYKLRMRKDEDCAVLCRRRYDMDSANRFARFIDDRYRCIGWWTTCRSHMPHRMRARGSPCFVVASQLVS